jgi:hypothetical protein
MAGIVFSPASIVGGATVPQTGRIEPEVYGLSSVAAIPVRRTGQLRPYGHTHAPAEPQGRDVA